MEENRSWKHGGIPQKIKAHEYLKSSDVIRNCGLSSWSHDFWWFLRPFLAQASPFHMCMVFFRQRWRNAGASFWRNWATSWTCRQQDSKIWSFRTVNCWILDQNMGVAGERIKLNMPKSWLNSYPTSTGRGLGGANAGFLHWAVFFPHPARRRVPAYLFAKFQVLLQPLPLFIRFHQFSPFFMVIQHLSISTWCRWGFPSAGGGPGTAQPGPLATSPTLLQRRLLRRCRGGSAAEELPGAWGTGLAGLGHGASALVDGGGMVDGWWIGPGKRWT